MNIRKLVLIVGLTACAQCVVAQETATDEKPAEQTEAPSTEQSTEQATEQSTGQPAARAAAGSGAPRADRLDLDTTVVTGNRELPKVLYIVPWKKAELGELPAQPFNTLLDEVLAPVDREEFRREVKYYGALTGDKPAADAASNSATR